MWWCRSSEITAIRSLNFTVYSCFNHFQQVNIYFSVVRKRWRGAVDKSAIKKVHPATRKQKTGSINWWDLIFWKNRYSPFLGNDLFLNKITTDPHNYAPCSRSSNIPTHMHTHVIQNSSLYKCFISSYVAFLLMPSVMRGTL